MDTVAMENLFRIVSAAELTTAARSGLVPRCPSDERSNCVHLNRKEDVETVANLYFTPEEAPVALEIRSADIAEDLTFLPATEGKPFQQANLARQYVSFSSVVAVHPLHVVQLNGAPVLKFGAAPNNSFKPKPLRGSA
ncbi:DUF952 domain-containing protein [Luteimonas sp. MC1828]|uniref:DUF952 domain-containing protein n=1 Tax=Luteimonas sp. MC1828 TaxID=2799787 RepID=UPI0018F13214|nr:DUF952 domain-containing protein [Luteimonas sp. MC1828]MBJ7575453.1 DUF952 domain-containing protein [Luteimonas sp. MC1828]